MIEDVSRRFGTEGLGTFDLAEGTCVFIEGTGPISELNPSSFAKSVQDMTCIIAGFDKVLVSHGYRRS
jgi:hypothetical protein